MEIRLTQQDIEDAIREYVRAAFKKPAEDTEVEFFIYKDEIGYLPFSDVSAVVS